MAAKENQGLQIALIIFVMLTILLAAGTFVFFRSYEEYQTKFTAAEKARGESETAMRTALDESTELKRVLGFDAKAKREDVQKKFADDAKLAPELKEADQNYPKLVEFMRSELSKKDADVAAKETANRALQEQLDKTTAESVAAATLYTEDTQKNNAEADKAKGEVDAARTAYKAEGQKLVDQFAKSRQEFNAKTAELQGVIAQREGNIKKLAGTVEEYAEERRQADVSSATPDGRISWVNQRARLVWVNLGSEDGLKRQTTFSVMNSETNNAISAEKKAEIEITRIIGAHLAEGQIVSDDISNPVLPGDLVFSPLFEAGRAEHFALAGFMDIDNDGRSDRERIKELIELAGGVVDAEVTDEGKKTGEVSVKTRYLVLGERPTDQGQSAEFRNSYTRVLTEAEQLGVKTMPVQELLDHIGYDPRKDRTVRLGADARPEDVRAELDQGVQRKSQGNVYEFKPRSPVQRGKTKSAY